MSLCSIKKKNYELHKSKEEKKTCFYEYTVHTYLMQYLILNKKKEPEVSAVHQLYNVKLTIFTTFMYCHISNLYSDLIFFSSIVLLFFQYILINLVDYTRTVLFATVTTVTMLIG